MYVPNPLKTSKSDHSSCSQSNANVSEGIEDLMKTKSFKRSNAAVGQSGMQALYETMFRNYGIHVGQVRKFGPKPRIPRH